MFIWYFPTLKTATVWIAESQKCMHKIAKIWNTRQFTQAKHELFHNEKRGLFGCRITIIGVDVMNNAVIRSFIHASFTEDKIKHWDIIQIRNTADFIPGHSRLNHSVPYLIIRDDGENDNQIIHVPNPSRQPTSSMSADAKEIILLNVFASRRCKQTYDDDAPIMITVEVWLQAPKIMLCTLHIEPWRTCGTLKQQLDHVWKQYVVTWRNTRVQFTGHETFMLSAFLAKVEAYNFTECPRPRVVPMKIFLTVATPPGQSFDRMIAAYLTLDHDAQKTPPISTLALGTEDCKDMMDDEHPNSHYDLNPEQVVAEIAAKNWNMERLTWVCLIVHVCICVVGRVVCISVRMWMLVTTTSWTVCHNVLSFVATVGMVSTTRMKNNRRMLPKCTWYVVTISMRHFVSVLFLLIVEIQSHPAIHVACPRSCLLVRR